VSFCPECNAAIAMTATSCTACGYSFPPPESAAEPSDWEYSTFAELSLMVGAFCTIIASLVLAYKSLGEFFARQVQNGMLSFLQAIVSVALCVVFLRVRK